MKLVRVPRGEFRRKYGGTSGGIHYTTKEGEHVIVFPEGASTRTRLHEIAHAELGHETKERISFGERARRELAADSWVYEKLGKDPSWYEVLGDFAPMVEELLEMGYTPNRIFNWVKKEVGDAGYIMDDDAKSFLWNHIRTSYEGLKKRR